MIVHTLSRADYALALWMARERNGIKEALGIASNKVSAADDLTIHRLGALAEVAVARHLGAAPDMAIHAGGDAGYDLVVGQWTIDVKMRSQPGRDLVIMPDMRDFRAQVVVLCWPGPTERDVRLVGYATRQRFLREARDDILRDPPRLVVPWRSLRPING